MRIVISVSNVTSLRIVFVWRLSKFKKDFQKSVSLSKSVCINVSKVTKSLGSLCSVMKTLIVGGNRQTSKQGTMSPIELLWTAKNVSMMRIVRIRKIVQFQEFVKIVKNISMFQVSSQWKVSKVKGYVFSSLWSNDSKVKSLWDCPLGRFEQVAVSEWLSQPVSESVSDKGIYRAIRWGTVNLGR